MYCISIGERDWVRKRGIRLDGKTQEKLCGKEPKEPLESTEEMRQREKGETGQKQGRNQWKRRSEEMYKKKKKGGKRKNNGYCMRETGEGNKTNAR